jgi:hypothetical protein
MTIPLSGPSLDSRACLEVGEVLHKIFPMMPHVTTQESIPLYCQTILTLLFSTKFISDFYLNILSKQFGGRSGISKRNNKCKMYYVYDNVSYMTGMTEGGKKV